MNRESVVEGHHSVLHPPYSTTNRKGSVRDEKKKVRKKKKHFDLPYVEVVEVGEIFMKLFTKERMVRMGFVPVDSKDFR